MLGTHRLRDDNRFCLFFDAAVDELRFLRGGRGRVSFALPLVPLSLIIWLLVCYARCNGDGDGDGYGCDCSC